MKNYLFPFLFLCLPLFLVAQEEEGDITIPPIVDSTTNIEAEKSKSA